MQGSDPQLIPISSRGRAALKKTEKHRRRQIEDEEDGKYEPWNEPSIYDLLNDDNDRDVAIYLGVISPRFPNEFDEV